jgi:hypothetical protein
LPAHVTVSTLSALVDLISAKLNDLNTEERLSSEL